MATAAGQADGTPPLGTTPHRIDFDTFMRLGELGIYPPRTELIDGIVYDVGPKGDPHYLAQAELVEQLVLRGQQRYRVGMEPTLKVDERNGPVPDVLVTPRDAAITAQRAILVVKVADSSLEYDRTEKRARYAASGVPEYWIVDLRGELVKRYCRPEPIRPPFCAPGTRLHRLRIPTLRSTSPCSSPQLARVAKNPSRSKEF